ncbi:MAG TPA: hypothetical protein VFG56_00195 [Candidatus Saccharimonadales bacterium]|nr:hypothetical protein [Candidatus Saccharimonadales bacterium]
MSVTTEETTLGRELSEYLGELECLAQQGAQSVSALDVMSRLTNICIDTQTAVWKLPERTQEILQQARQVSQVTDHHGLCGNETLLLRLVTRHLRESLAV